MVLAMTSAPLPTPELARRVGVLDQDDPLPSFDELGKATKRWLVELLPAGWFDGKRILDFGCGPGKALRHFLPEAERCEIYGCDIHEPSIRWLQEKFSPPLNVFVCGETPPLPFPGEHLDLVWAMSVFTHLADHWADWLLELHRVLRPDGRLVATFLGEGMSESIAGEPWDPDRVGTNVLRAWQSWDQGGPSVQHSEWWLREHWGRAFDIERVEDGPEFGHGIIVLRKRPVALGREDLTAPSNDPRELVALQHNVRQLQREAVLLAEDRDAVSRSREEAWATARGRDEAASAAAETLRVVVTSHSWRFTKPLRAAVRLTARFSRRRPVVRARR